MERNYKYLDLEKHWEKLKPYFQSQEAKTIWFREMVTFDVSRMFDYELEDELKDKNYDYEKTLFPSYFDYFNSKREGKPAFWDYAVHLACHWVAPTNLYVAMKSFPERDWRIITSEPHTTVWDGEDTFFDTNFYAFGIDANKTAKEIFNHDSFEEHPISEFVFNNEELDEWYNTYGFNFEKFKPMPIEKMVYNEINSRELQNKLLNTVT